MNKEEFLAELKNGLKGLPWKDVDERLAFYAEMIDDRMEEGLTESEAVAGIGTVGDIVSQIAAEVPLTKLVREKVASRRSPRVWETVLIVLGFPLWFSLLAAAFVIVLSFYIVVWALIISLWAVGVSLAACAAGGIAAALFYLVRGNIVSAVTMLGFGLMCTGFAIIMFYICRGVSKWILRMTKASARALKARLIRKENAKW